MFQLKFSPVVIKHLGLSMYSTLPPVLAELITNSYDADASEVTITINQQNKSIEVLDNGCGMTANELNQDFLNVGRNRREKDTTIETEKFTRKVTGKKGIGKLSVFGICSEIYVESCKDGEINAFEMNYEELVKRKDDGPLDLQPKIDNEKTTKESYTKIELRELSRKSIIPVIDTANSILTRLNIFDKNFKCTIEDNKESKELTNEARIELIEKGRQFYWNLPSSFEKLNIEEDTIKYFEDNNITGRIITTKDTIKEAFKGITLYARGKLANNPEFYGVKLSNSHAFSYMNGSIDIDYLDKETGEDNISTARNSLIWENDEPAELKRHLQEVIKKIGSNWREQRIEERDKELTETHNINTTWYESTIQSRTDKKLAKKITDIVVSSDLDIKKTKDLIQYVQGAFEFEVFRDYASDIENNIDGDKLLKLLKDWEVIESKEQYRLAIGRIETINKFRELIEADTKEVGGIESMHKFLNTFPWILEPRISSFDDEKTYKQILIENFPDTTLEIKNRRIDFLCKNFGDTLYVLEIKRSQKIIGKDDLMQLAEYCEFISTQLRENNSDRSKLSRVKGYIIGKELQDNGLVRTKRNNMESNNMFFLSYKEMLDQAEQYHKEFIDSYEKINNLLPSSDS
ncbi:MAG: ATP-binding protein [Campylobacterales bacterium]|nr:ATP-binding protein [Campylobacterales bacterium]